MEKIKYIGCTILIILFAFSCKPKISKEVEREEARQRRSLAPNPTTWDTLKVDTIQPFMMTGLEAKLHLKVDQRVLREYENMEILKKINNEIVSQSLGENYVDTVMSASDILNRYIVSFLDDYATKMKKYGESPYKTHAFEQLEHSYELKTETLYDEANLISYQITITEKMGSDSTETIIVKNLLLDLVDGRLLMEEDVFQENYADTLNQTLVNQILVDHKSDTISTLQTQGYWGVADLEANNNFYVDRNSIIYTFNPGEYAEAEKGILKIAVDFDSLQTILKKESPISILIGE